MEKWNSELKLCEIFILKNHNKIITDQRAI